MGVDGVDVEPFFDGSISVEHGKDWVRPWRLRHEERSLYGPSLAAMAACAAVRMVFSTSGRSFRLVAAVGSPLGVDEDALQKTSGPLEYDLYVNGDFFARQYVPRGSGVHTAKFDDLPEGKKELEVWLPTCVPLNIHSIDCGSAAVERPLPDARPIWLCYGSSITHGGPSAAPPSESWAAVCARMANVRLTNLGFGGECFLDTSVARVIRDTPCHCISLKVGINIQTTAALTARTLMSALIGFIQTIRDGHPVTPIVLVSPIWYGPLETRAPVRGLGFVSLQQFRSQAKAAVETLRAHGDEHVFYRNGLELLSEADESHLYDQLHPDAQGHKLMGQRFADLEFGPNGRLFPGRAEHLVAAANRKLGHTPAEGGLLLEHLIGGYFVEMPGEKRSKILVRQDQGVLRAVTDRPDWEPQPLRIRGNFVFLLKLPGVWGCAEGEKIYFSNGALWLRVPQRS